MARTRGSRRRLITCGPHYPSLSPGLSSHEPWTLSVPIRANFSHRRLTLVRQMVRSGIWGIVPGHPSGFSHGYASCFPDPAESVAVPDRAELQRRLCCISSDQWLGLARSGSEPCPCSSRLLPSPILMHSPQPATALGLPDDLHDAMLHKKANPLIG